MRPSDRRQSLTRSGFLATWVALSSCDASARTEVAAAEPAPAASPTTEAQRTDADQMVGTYRHSGGQAEKDAVLAAIEDVVADMNIVTRGIARDRLQETNTVPSAVAIERVGDTLKIAFDGREYAAPLDGSTVKVVGVTGETLDYRVEVSEDRIRQHFVGSRGGRVNTIRRRGDTGLRVDVKVSSESLPKPLEYRLTLKRKA